MTNPLKDDFASFAEHAAVPDMHARVLAESRRLGVRRAVVSGVAALAVLVGGVTGAFAVAGDRLNDDTVDVASPLPGTFYYLDRGGAQGATRVLAWSPEDDEPTVVLEGDDTLRSTAAISPDGRRIAWREPVGDGLTASLLVKDLATGAVTTLMDGFRYLPCGEPVWTSDGTRILVGRQPLDNGVSASYVDPNVPQTFGDSVEIPGCHPRFITEGEHAGEILYWGDDGLGAVTATGGPSTVDTDGLSSVVYDSLGRFPYGLVSISADGSRACISTDRETVDRALYCDVVADVTGKTVSRWSQDFATSYLLVGDKLVSRSGGVLTVLDASGSELGTITEPGLGGDAELLAYTA